MLVYLNGEFKAQADAHVSIEDRGFLLADGLYEVARVYEGRPFLMAEHLERLARGLESLKIDFKDVEALSGIADRLLEENKLDGDATIYIQVTRGAAPRKHAFPAADTPPSVLVAARPFTQHPDEYFEKGVAAATVPDTRWARCDIKSIALLPNVLANQAAQDADAFEALFVRDGIVLEGSHSNLFGVYDGALVTAPKTNYILPGITREYVLKMAHDMGIPAHEAPIRLEDLADADELFLTGTTTEVMPVTRVDGRAVADGAPGPVTKRLITGYRAGIE